jgi:hypothetical protein
MKFMRTRDFPAVRAADIARLCALPLASKSCHHLVISRCGPTAIMRSRPAAQLLPGIMAMQFHDRRMMNHLMLN